MNGVMERVIINLRQKRINEISDVASICVLFMIVILVKQTPNYIDYQMHATIPYIPSLDKNVLTTL